MPSLFREEQEAGVAQWHEQEGEQWAVRSDS